MSEREVGAYVNLFFILYIFILVARNRNTLQKLKLFKFNIQPTPKKTNFAREKMDL